MRILYVARHGQGHATSNDDEGAIAFALRKLGHEVRCVPERSNGFEPYPGHPEFDFCLFHKWSDFQSMAVLARRVPLVMWYFDLVTYPDPTLAGRNAQRMAWMGSVLPLIKVGFITDGDWQARFPNKLVWLPQGADERVVGRAAPLPDSEPGRILFTGAVANCGTGRAAFVSDLTNRYGGKFAWVPQGLHGRALASLIASHDVFVCPPTPVTHRYWSNRVYLGAGFGACMLHAHADNLTPHFFHDKEIIYYTDRDNLYSKLDYCIENAPYCRRVSQAALERCLCQHLYRHRCETLIETVKERL